MPRTTGVILQNNFSKGLITEGTPLNFPKDSCTETFNCVFEYTGSVHRRSEFDLEDGFVLSSSLSFLPSDVYTEFLWEQVSDAGTYSFLVQQTGNTLRFYNTSNSTTVSSNVNSNTVDLSTFRADDSTIQVNTVPCQYAQGNGVLIVVSRAIDPIYISYDTGTDTMTATKITIEFRDFQGLTDIYAIDERPAFSTVANMKADPDGAAHYYNILNQGWWQGTITTNELSTTSALGQWDADVTSGSPAVGHMPSNCDQVSFYRASETDPFDPNRLIGFQQGNTLAPKGHFILELGNVDRRQAVVDSGLALDLSGTAAQLIPVGTGTVIGNLNTDSVIGNAFDGVYDPSSSITVSSTAFNATIAKTVFTTGSTGNGYIGKNLGTGKKINSARWYGAQSNVVDTNYSAFMQQVINITGSGLYQAKSCSITLYAKNSLPANGTDGVILGTQTWNPSSSTNLKIDSNDKTTLYQYIWFYVSVTGGLVGSGKRFVIACPEMEIFEDATFTGNASFTEADKTPERPQCVAYFAGRVFYGGVNHEKVSNSIYFSQIIENDGQYGLCYQQNDPTSEIFFDLLPSDGGVIRIPDMGELIKLFAYQTALVAIATNGVWIIRGSSGAGFLATDFVIRKLSSRGSQSGFSVVDVEGIPYWFAESGILNLDYNPQFDSFSVQCSTDTTIRTFYLDIPTASRTNAKGSYDPYNQFIYWIYADIPYQYNHLLMYNLKTQAFMPWTIEDNMNTVPIITGIQFVEDSVGSSNPEFKFPVTINIDDSHQYLTYAGLDHATPHWIDWYSYDQSQTGDGAHQTDYVSYFITGYEIDANAQQFSQVNYVIFYLDTIENSGAFMQGIWDWTNTGNSGRWSVTQQLYNANVAADGVVSYRRLKVRGKGRSLQFRVISESGKPFSIAGWSRWSTGNSQD